MGRKPMITKACPSCDHNVAVASKKCKCGHSFNSKPTRTVAVRAASEKNPPAEEKRRATRGSGQRKRGKPKYYDSQEYDKRKKKVKRTRQTLQQTRRVAINEKESDKGKIKETTAARAQRRRLKKEEENGGGDLVAKYIFQ